MSCAMPSSETPHIRGIHAAEDRDVGRSLEDAYVRHTAPMTSWDVETRENLREKPVPERIRLPPALLLLTWTLPTMRDRWFRQGDPTLGPQSLCRLSPLFSASVITKLAPHSTHGVPQWEQNSTEQNRAEQNKTECSPICHVFGPFQRSDQLQKGPNAPWAQNQLHRAARYAGCTDSCQFPCQEWIFRNKEAIIGSESGVFIPPQKSASGFVQIRSHFVASAFFHGRGIWWVDVAAGREAWQQTAVVAVAPHHTWEPAVRDRLRAERAHLEPRLGSHVRPSDVAAGAAQTSFGPRAGLAAAPVWHPNRPALSARSGWPQGHSTMSTSHAPRARERLSSCDCGDAVGLQTGLVGTTSFLVLWRCLGPCGF